MKKEPISAILKRVNKVRVAMGQKPLKKMPKGKQDQPKWCPLAIAFNKRCKVYGGGYGGIEFRSMEDADLAAHGLRTTINYGYTVSTPRWVDDFVIAFDKGRYPTLIK